MTVGSAYLELLKRTITNYTYLGGDRPFDEFDCSRHYDLKHGDWTIDPLSKPMTLLSLGQLDLIERSIMRIAQDGVAGDFIEAGVWRGGAIALMRAVADRCGLADRTVWAADSFAGIPQNSSFPHDPVDRWPDRWIASVDEVKGNLARLGLLDARIRFVEGFFEETLPHLALARFALVRLDSDAHDSVAASLEHLYPLVSLGGVVIVDDWHLIPCQMAVGAYRSKYGIKDEIVVETGNAWWTKS